MLSLNDEHVQSMNQQGFLRLPGLTSVQEAAAIRLLVERLFLEKAGQNEGAYGELAPTSDGAREPNSPQILLPVNYAPELHKTECFTNGLRIARQILGDNAEFIRDVAIFKRAKRGSPTPWHQDVAFHDPQFQYKEITIWMALQDVNETSGCLMFIPGSHEGPIREHTAKNRDGESLALECTDQIDVSTAVKCPISAGGCTIHFPATLHCSTPNQSEVPRIAYIMTFGTTPVAATEPLAFPWLEQRDTGTRLQRRKWMRRGGVFITAWRRLRRGDLRDWRSSLYWAKRAVKTISRGE
jgi:hypothetical protein